MITCPRILLTKMSPSVSPAHDYWTTAREPWPSLVFIVPFLLVYEVGALAHAHLPASRNGADLWIRQLSLDQGWEVDWALPLLAPCLLLGWQIVGRRPWKWNHETFAGMFAESLLFAMVLVLLGQVTALAFPQLPEGAPAMLSVGHISRVVSFLGAGIYEEMVFRLLLLPVTFVLLRLLLLPAFVSGTCAILITSWLFATAHYVDSQALLSPEAIQHAMQTVLDNPELWFSYCFRLLAGIQFALLFWFRGFGIAVGCHILYDLFVGVLLAGI